MKKLLIVLVIGFSILQTACSTDSVSNSNAANPVDVYIAGSKDGHACYWKNNQMVSLDSGNFTDYAATKMLVSDNGDVYVLGYGFIGSSTSSSLLWKNGVITNLKQSLGFPEYTATILDIQVVGNDVYYVGYTYAVPFDINSPSKLAYWKNNVITVVDEFPQFVFSEARIKVVGNDVCIIAANDGSSVIKGYYLNSVYHQLPGNWTYNLVTDDNQIYAYGSQQPDGFYYNISSGVNTNVSTPNSGGINHMAFDNDNMYYSDGERIFKNGTIIYTENLPTNNIFDFKPLNNNLFVISGGNDVNNANEELRINGVTTMTATDGENFASLFLVQN